MSAHWKIRGSVLGIEELLHVIVNRWLMLLNSVRNSASACSLAFTFSKARAALKWMLQNLISGYDHVPISHDGVLRKAWECAQTTVIQSKIMNTVLLCYIVYY